MIIICDVFMMIIECVLVLKHIILIVTCFIMNMVIVIIVKIMVTVLKNCHMCHDGNYFISLDLLVGIEMKKGETSFNQQPTIVYLTFMFLLILIINLIFNTISIFCIFE
jgi:hypothetical protein